MEWITLKQPPGFGRFFDLITILLQPNCRIQAFKHVFTSPSSVEQEPKAMRSGNVHLHGMRSAPRHPLHMLPRRYCLFAFDDSSLLNGDRSALP